MKEIKDKIESLIEYATLSDYTEYGEYYEYESVKSFRLIILHKGLVWAVIITDDIAFPGGSNTGKLAFYTHILGDNSENFRIDVGTLGECVEYLIEYLNLNDGHEYTIMKARDYYADRL